MRNPPLHRYATRPGLYFTDDGGADVVVRSETADQVWLCVLEPIDEPSAFFQDAIRLFEDPNISFIQQIHEFPVCTRIIEHLYLRETLFRMTGPNYGLWYVHLPKAWDGMRYGYRVDGAWDRNMACASIHTNSCLTRMARASTAPWSSPRRLLL